MLGARTCVQHTRETSVKLDVCEVNPTILGTAANGTALSCTRSGQARWRERGRMTCQLIHKILYYVLCLWVNPVNSHVHIRVFFTSK